MDIQVPVEFIWTLVVGAITVAVSYGGLLVKVIANTTRIAEVERAAGREVSILRETIREVAEAQAAHRNETTDRLARIESKIDYLVGDRNK